jgi:hypothetical protein
VEETAAMDSNSLTGKVDLNFETAQFDGVIIAVLAYGEPELRLLITLPFNERAGALVMLYIQLLRVLLTRPKRGKVFWGISIYSGALFALSTIAAGGKIKFAEYVYVSSRFAESFDPNQSDTWIPSQVFKSNADMTMNVMSWVWYDAFLFLSAKSIHTI